MDYVTASHCGLIFHVHGVFLRASDDAVVISLNTEFEIVDEVNPWDPEEMR
jgi:hypothetical protein